MSNNYVHWFWKANIYYGASQKRKKDRCNGIKEESGKALSSTLWNSLYKCSLWMAEPRQDTMHV